MKRDKPVRLWALATVGIMTAVAAVSVSRFGTRANPAVTVSALSAALWHAIHTAAARLTTAQLTEAAAAAWLIFVLSLVLLARSRPTGPRTKETEREASNAAAIPEAGRAPRSAATHALAHTSIPPLPVRSAPVGEASSVYDSSFHGMQSVPSNGSAASVSTVLDAPVESGIVDKALPRGLGAWTGGRTLEPTQGHTLALTGVTQTSDRLLPYGLFMVAEDAGVTGRDGTASQRAVKVIAEQMGPVLASNLILGSEQCGTLLKMAVLHASIDLVEQRIRVVSNLDAAVTAALVMDDTAHVATIGACRTYRFGLYDGLVPIAADQLATLQLTQERPRDQEALYEQPLRDAVYSDKGASPPACEVSTCDTHLEPADLLLLTSPRLLLALPQPEVEAILRQAPDSRAAARLLAHEAGRRTEGQDFGVVVVQLLEGWMPSFGIAAAHAGLL
jgi:serine/threonine protein phosphatase PrpC